MKYIVIIEDNYFHGLYNTKEEAGKAAKEMCGDDLEQVDIYEISDRWTFKEIPTKYKLEHIGLL